MDICKKKKIDIVLLYSSGHLGSMIVLNRIVKMKCFNVKGIISAANLEFSEKGIKKVTRQIRKTGVSFALMLILQRVIQALGYALAYLVPYCRKRLKTSADIAAELNIPVIQTSDINSLEALEAIETLAPELIISAYFPMILKEKALKAAPLGILNIHPGWLPEYKGAMTYFWAVKNNETQAGVSLHWMDEGIDTGPLLARRKFRLHKNMTQEKVLIMTAVIGSQLLHRIGKKLVKGKDVPVIDVSREKSHYYKMPNAAEYSEYRLKHKFFSTLTLLSIIVDRK